MFKQRIGTDSHVRIVMDKKKKKRLVWREHIWQRWFSFQGFMLISSVEFLLESSFPVKNYISKLPIHLPYSFFLHLLALGQCSGQLAMSFDDAFHILSY